MNITLETLRKLCRYECTFTDIVGKDRNQELFVEEEYTLTLDDLYTALRQYAVKQDIDELEEEWFWPVFTAYQNDFVFLDEMPEGMKSMGMPTEYSVLSEAWDDLYILFESGEGRSPEEITEEIRIFMEQKDRPLLNRELSDQQKLDFLNYWEDRYPEAAPEIVTLYRKYLNELCDKENPEALHIKAYACYGNGNGFFRQDWHASMKCLLKLFEMEGDPFIANTLGYMYYYGRCNNSVPQYEEAFRYFSAGAAGGVYESRYKLSDMFRHGRGIPKNEKIAASLIWEVYWDTMRHFLLEREDSPFADAALRAGNIFRYGINEDPDPDRAVYYYLQVRYAIRRRMRVTDQYGDKYVSKRIDEALAEVLPQSQYASKSRMTYHPTLQYLLADTLVNPFQMEMRMNKHPDGSVHLTIRCIPPADDFEPQLLLTVPGSHYCGKVPQLDVELIHIRHISFTENDGPVIFDAVRGNEFYLYHRRVAVIEGQFALKVTPLMEKGTL